MPVEEVRGTDIQELIRELERHGYNLENSEKENTLQSIDGTLKRIEAILLKQKNNLPSKIELSIGGKEFSKFAFQSIHDTCEEIQSNTTCL